MENGSRQRELLKKYLNQYYILRRRMRTLEQRLKEAEDELQHPSIKSSLGNMTPSKGGQSIGVAAPILKEESLFERFAQMKNERTRIMAEIMNILSLLPDSDEREILEYRHMDGMRWSEIQERMKMSRSPCFQCYRRGLNRLLSFQCVREILSDFEEKSGKDEQ